MTTIVKLTSDSMDIITITAKNIPLTANLSHHGQFIPSRPTLTLVLLCYRNASVLNLHHAVRI